MGTRTGTKTLADIDETLRQVRGSLDAVDAQYAAARSEAARLQQQIVAAYARLAKLRLLEIERGAVLAPLDDADRRVEEILDERERAATDLSRQLEAAGRERDAEEQNRTAQQSVVAAASEAVDAAESEARRRLEADPCYQAQLAATEQADFTADQAEDKASAAERDRIDKGRPYENDPLFSYLWSRQYGTARYSAWPLTRWLDAKVAKLCRYEQARRNYSMLIQIPERLREHAAEMQSRFDHEAESLRALEQEAAEATHVPERQTAFEAAEHELAEIDTRIAEIEDRIKTLVEERGRFAAGEDAYYLRCLKILGEALQKESVLFLRERAARTNDREDDALVTRLNELSRTRDGIDEDLAQFRRMHETLSERVTQFEDVRRRFKQRRYDDPHSYFINAALIATVLNQFLSGSARAGDVWDTLKRQQRNRPVQPNFGTLRFPHAPRPGPWRLPRGGGFGGGGFRRGGGFGGGRFKTGGGF